MLREIIAVFQDCVMCGDKGRKKALNLAKDGVFIRKVSFVSPEGKELCRQAVFDHGIRTMPFYVDGDKFATSLDELLGNNEKKPAKTTKKKAKKTTKNKKSSKEVTDGSISED